MSRLFVLTLGLYCAFAEALFAQAERIRDTNAHMWWIYVGDHPFKGKFGFYTEANVRRANFGSSWQQLLLREAITYRLSPNVKFAAGYGAIRNARYGDFPIGEPNWEHRAWEQIALTHQISKLAFEHRYRLEQRFIQQHQPAQDFFWRYQNRFRYQFTATLPLTPRTYVFGADELFINFGANYGASTLDQNRLIGGVGYRLTRNNKVEAHYLNHFVVQRNGFVEESNHTFRLQWTSSTPLARLFRY